MIKTFFMNKLSNDAVSEPIFLSRYEVADLLKVCITTVHNYTKRGYLKPYGIGRRVLYKKSEVENAIVEL